jgi:lipid-binding SYLF domain-containing protein
MNTNSTHALTEPTINFGGEASGTAGNASGKAEGDATDDGTKRMLVYTDATGLYGGAAIKGGALAPDTNANVAYYGQFLTPQEILFDQKGTPTEAATSLVQKITESSK